MKSRVSMLIRVMSMLTWVMSMLIYEHAHDMSMLI